MRIPTKVDVRDPKRGNKPKISCSQLIISQVMETNPKRGNKPQSTNNVTSYGNGSSITSCNCQNKKYNWKHGTEF